MDKRSDTIAAIGTPPGRSGIGIIRISGPNTLELIHTFIRSKIDILSLTSSQTRKLIHAYIIDGENKIDEILLAYMPSNKSYTGEPTVELNCHGGRAILTYVLELILKNGARLAEPGEFTRRAFVNGRLDLVQAEAVNDLINARTKKAIKAAWRQMEGGLTKRCKDLKNTLLSVLTEIQAEIDFEVECNQKKWVDKISHAETIIHDMLDTAEKNKYLTQGCWVVISGPPNAGKSSLFNDIINIERSIVCDTPGTTRDHISETIDIDGIEVRLTDTAGIRDTNDKIESISIERSKQQISSADVVVYVLDQNKMLGGDEKKQAEKVLKEDGLIVFNKTDLKTHHTVKEFIDNKKSKNIICISVLTKYGLDKFLDRLAELIDERTQGSEDPFVANIRQIRLLESARNNLLNVVKVIKQTNNLDIGMFEIQQAVNKLSEIIGDIANEEILNNIFSKFCVGK